MSDIKWLRRELILAAHHAQIAQHGGTAGIRNEGLLDSALARPVNLAAYEEGVTIPRIAAAYLFGIARNHPFVDGNKRVAYAAAETFVILNGLKIDVSQLEKYEMTMLVASGEMDENGIADWLAAHCR